MTVVEAAFSWHFDDQSSEYLTDVNIFSNFTGLFDSMLMLLTRSLLQFVKIKNLDLLLSLMSISLMPGRKAMSLCKSKRISKSLMSASFTSLRYANLTISLNGFFEFVKIN